ncbi:MAG: 2-oxoacid:acceptor oxidoreductase family protein [Desulfobacterales bacterium]
MEICRIVFAGSGGQGVITAAIVLAEAAVIYEDLIAVQSQSYGPEARGGSTRSDVIVADSPIRYPKVNQPNVLVCLTQESYNKYYPIIRPGGILITDLRHVTPLSRGDARQLALPIYDTVMAEIGSPVVQNICMLGAVAGITGLVRRESIMSSLKGRVPPEFLAMNQKALRLGFGLVADRKDAYPACMMRV